MSQTVQIAAFYHFQSVPERDLERLSLEMESLGEKMDLRGLAIFATEGINGTVAGVTREAVEGWLRAIESLLGFPMMTPRWTESETWPFRLFKIRLRSEIVTLGKPEVQPLPAKSPTHLSPADWNRALEDENCVLIDTRNFYETRIGTFKNAIDPQIEEFQDFSRFVSESEIEKDKKVLIFCTGGIRCEKAIVEMNNQGFQNVFQLEGGILNYLKEFPNQAFEGECFVFDSRVAVDQQLRPTENYQLCPHCGQPADQPVQCRRCETDALICIDCTRLDHRHTCSKNCAHHSLIAPEKKGKSQGPSYRFLSSTQRRSSN